MRVPNRPPDWVCIRTTRPIGPAARLALLARQTDRRHPGQLYLSEWTDDGIPPMSDEATIIFRPAPPPEQRLRFLPDRPLPGVLFEIRQARAWPRGSRVYARIRPTGGWWARGEVAARPGVRPSIAENRAAHRVLLLLMDWLEAQRGRPEGTGAFEDAEAFMAVFGAAVKELRCQHRNPTTGAVLRHLHSKQGKIHRAQLTRWHQGFGWPTWQDFVNDVD